MEAKISQSRTMVILAAALLSACASDPLRQAQDKPIKVDDKSFLFGGTYNEKTRDLKLSINGEPVMQGRFPPFTPTQNFNSTYENVPLSVHCYFGSVLASEGGAVGIVAGVIQSVKSSSADKCELSHNDVVKGVLYF